MLDYAIYYIKRNKKGLQIVFRLINNDISLQYGGSKNVQQTCPMHHIHELYCYANIC